jgi:EpsI family protein
MIVTARYSRPEYAVNVPALANFALVIGEWQRQQDDVLDQGVYEMLAPSDFLDRTYTNGALSLNLFVAYYKSQHQAKGAHDPKVCLPGAGWNPISSKVIQIPVPGQPDLSANFYVVAKESLGAVVVYWYQTHNQVFTQEQSLHLNRILETITDNRTDVALVRIVVPDSKNNIAAAGSVATQFAQTIFPLLQAQFVPQN